MSRGLKSHLMKFFFEKGNNNCNVSMDLSHCLIMTDMHSRITDCHANLFSGVRLQR